MFEIEVKDIFKITGRGFVIGGEVINRATVLRNGDTLINRNNKEHEIIVESIEMVNFGSRQFNLNRIGLLVDIKEDEAATAHNIAFPPCRYHSLVTGSRVAYSK